MPSQPSDEEEANKLCAHVNEETGETCRGFHMSDSPFCYPHAGGIKIMNERRTAQAKRKAELKESLEFGDHSLQTRQDILSYYGKLVNGVMSGVVKRADAACVSVMLPTMVKIAKELEMGGKQQHGMTIKMEQDIEGNRKIFATIPTDQMDDFLLGNDHVSIKILNDLQKTGNYRTEKRPPMLIDVTPGAIDEIPIPAKELERMGKDAGVPLKKKAIINLFGDMLGDTKEDEGSEPFVDLEGLEDVFNPDGLPKETEPRPHKWKSRYENKGEFAVRHFDCVWCGATVAKPNKEDCPQAKYDENDYETPPRD